MQKDPIFTQIRFPCYLTERQPFLLKEVAKERGAPVTELLREAVHYWLKEKGKDDGLLFSIEETVEAYERAVKKL